MRRQPRARTGSGGYAPSMKGKDPRANKAQPTVAEDTVRSSALQKLASLDTTASTAEIVTALNDIVSALQGRKVT